MSLLTASKFLFTRMIYATGSSIYDKPPRRFQRLSRWMKGAHYIIVNSKI